MNIFFLGYSLKQGSGGIENYTFTILKYLEAQGHNVTVFTLNDISSEFNHLKVSRQRFIDRFFLNQKIIREIKRRQNDFDLFLCGHLFLTDLMEAIGNKFNIKYHLFVYGIDCWAGRYAEHHNKLNNLNKIISISSFTTKQIKKQGFEGEIIYLPPVLDPTNYPKINEIKLEQKNKTVFLTVGRLDAGERYKGHDMVIEAIELLVKQGIKNIEYRIVGKGDDLNRLENKINSLGLNNYIKLYGFVSEENLHKIYAESDIFIMPSNVSLDPSKPEGEGFGIVFTEAAMFELALIGPNIGGSTDIIESEVNGLECDPKNVEDIANKMELMIVNPQQRKEYGKAARQKILENFTYQNLHKYTKGLVDQ